MPQKNHGSPELERLREKRDEAVRKSRQACDQELAEQKDKKPEQNI